MRVPASAAEAVRMKPLVNRVSSPAVVSRQSRTRESSVRVVVIAGVPSPRVMVRLPSSPRPVDTSSISMESFGAPSSTWTIGPMVGVPARI